MPYLLEIINKELSCKVNRTKGLDYFIDADFARDQTLNNPLNPSNILSRSRFVIIYVGVPIFQRSKLQIEIVLLIYEAEYIVLSLVTSKVISLLQLPKDLNLIITLQILLLKFIMKYLKIIKAVLQQLSLRNHQLE